MKTSNHHQTKTPRQLGLDVEKIVIADDFDAPMPELEVLFYGEGSDRSDSSGIPRADVETRKIECEKPGCKRTLNSDEIRGRIS